MVTREVLGNQNTIFALKNDIKPIENVINGTPLVVMDGDNGPIVYMFDGENKEWIEFS
jgi:hypothetical protein